DLYFTQLGNDLFRFGSFRHLSAPFAKPRLTDSPDHFPGSRPSRILPILRPQVTTTQITLPH
ncbi:MAG: hypothetical protein WBX25_37510, partial [Rhodomicrobium sp.]